jgi:anti-sigma regulatory factor (Ser/Thr protein kinase)
MPEWTLPSEPASVPRARKLVAEALAGITPLALDNVALVVSELATNCVRHAKTEFQLCVSYDGESVRVEVTDRGAGRPAAGHPGPEQPQGRGLFLVQAITRRWGVIPAPTGDGKTVWCTLSA